MENKPNVSRNGSPTLPGTDNPGLRHYREDGGGGGGNVLHAAMDIRCGTTLGCGEKESI